LGGQVKYTVDYDVTASGQTVKTTMVMDLPKFVMVSVAQGIETRSIFDGSSMTVCSKPQGSWMCFKQDVKVDSQKIEGEVKSGTAKTTYLGACSVAGEAGMNYEVESNGVKSNVCYTSDGILLSMKTTSTEMKATKVSRTVDSSLFTPPASAQDLSNLVPGGTIPGGSAPS
jgi:hypothetical protein